jgi:uncharacterized protein YqeY
MTDSGAENLRERLGRALPAAMKARDRVAVAALRSALAAIANAEAVDPSRPPPQAAPPPDSTGPVPEPPNPRAGHPEPATSGTGHPEPAGSGPGPPDPGSGPPEPAGSGPGPRDPRTGPPEPAGSGGDPPFAGTVAGVGATEMERRSLTGEQVEEVVRAEIAERETAAAEYERAGQLQHAERLRGEAKVLTSHLEKP